ncbi:MAG: histidinol-phosphate transaminase [Candidimonas sp.]|nr:MAG: histidinol-phosphate transaminase [Candidimonas sp.]TAM22963.1 MAG: histidinol-phosphate transaminase [Candidimonas sp.]TAM77591.1 MAG: histidinol-phosphate transaminase [Candidimonas sp.]
MSRFWSDQVAGLAPYVPGEQLKRPNLLKLNTNEHPYGPSPRALEAIRAASTDHLRFYPDFGATALREAIAALHSIQADQVFLGNGSDEVLAHVFNGLFRKAGRIVLMPDVGYSFYPVYCRFYQIPHEFIPVAADFSIQVADYTTRRATAPAGIIFANPNAPTGMALTLASVEQILAANPDSVVVVDEAYVDFGAQTAVPLLGRYDNLVVVHTLSKSRALAGLRVGYALASPQIVEGLLRIKDSFNSYPLDSIAQAGARAAIQDEAYFDQMCRAVIRAREHLVKRLKTLGFQVLPSLTNFVFARHPGHSAASLHLALRERAILVRHFKQPRIEQFLRITVGTPDDCERLSDVLAEILDTSGRDGQDI